MYLAYTHVDELPAEEKYVLATDMALASVTGESIFNFGEVIATPILGALKGSPNQWMHDLVLAMNRGSIDDFNSLVNANRDAYFAQPSLSSRHESIKKKIVLLALMNIAFERPSHDRQISFADIAQRTRIPLDQVEWVLMRAFSLGLVKGTIDQIDQSVSITWVQPRVLDKEQLGLLCGQLESWSARVRTTLVTVQDQTPELIN
jgi:26S proteasome regulatory subunit N9